MTFSIGIDLGKNSVRFGVIGRDVEPVWRQEIAFTPEMTSTDKMHIIEDFVKDASLRYQIVRAGIIADGETDMREGLLWNEEAGFDAFPVRDLLADALRMPVWFDARVHADMMSEWTGGACKGAENAVYLLIGDTIEGSVITDGRLSRGRNGSAGGMGHIITHVGGEECKCGRRGCFNMYASLGALERASAKTAKRCIELSRNGDRAMREVFETYLANLQAGIESILSAYAPEVIVFGGDVTQFGRYIPDTLHRRLTEEGVWSYDEEVHLTIARHTVDAGIIGAAALADYYLNE